MEEDDTKETSPEPPKKGRRRKSNPQFEENDKMRTQSAKKRGPTLKKLVEEFRSKTGGKAFVKIQYISVLGKLYEWKGGEDFQLLSKNEADDRYELPPLPFANPIPESTQSHSHSSAVALVHHSAQTQTHKQTLNTFDMGKDSVAIRSNERKNQRPRSLPMKSRECHLCSKVFVEYGERNYESGWMDCSWNNGAGYSCATSVHTDCLGFPGLISEEEIAILPDYYCPMHIQTGRALHNVNSSYLLQTAPRVIDSDEDIDGDGDGEGEADIDGDVEGESD